MEEDYFERFFKNIWKNSVRMLGSAISEDSELFEQRPCSDPGRRSPDASNIVTDCQKNRYPSFISCPYNLRRLMSSNVRRKTSRAGALRNRSKLYQPFAIKLTEAGTLFHQNSQVTRVNIRDSLHILCTKNCGHWSVFVEVIWKYNRGPVFEPQCRR